MILMVSIVENNFIKKQLDIIDYLKVGTLKQLMIVKDHMYFQRLSTMPKDSS